MTPFRIFKKCFCVKFCNFLFDGQLAMFQYKMNLDKDIFLSYMTIWCKGRWQRAIKQTIWPGAVTKSRSEAHLNKLLGRSWHRHCLSCSISSARSRMSLWVFPTVANYWFGYLMALNSCLLPLTLAGFTWIKTVIWDLWFYIIFANSV